MKKVNKLFTFLLFIIVSVIICSFILIRYYSSVIEPAFMIYAESEVKRIATLIIHKSISYELDSGMDVEGMFQVVKNQKDEIEMIDFDTVAITKILHSLTCLIEENLEAVMLGEDSTISMDFDRVSDMDYEHIGNYVIFEATMGSFTGSSLISNIGPKVPVKLNIVGDVLGNVETKVREYGINNALIELGIKIGVDTMVSTPFVSKVVHVEVVIPVAMKVISGSIPNYYLNEMKSSSNLVRSE